MRFKPKSVHVKVGLQSVERPTSRAEVCQVCSLSDIPDPDPDPELDEECPPIHCQCQVETSNEKEKHRVTLLDTLTAAAP